MRLVELARVIEAQRNLVGIGTDEAVQIYNFAIFFDWIASPALRSRNDVRGGDGLLRS